MKILRDKEKDELLKHITTLALRAQELLIANYCNKRLTAESSDVARRDINEAAFRAAYILGGFFEMRVMKEMLIKNTNRVYKQFSIKKQEEGGTDD